MNNQPSEFWSGREFEKLLGTGTYGQVFLESCADLDEKRYNAAKVIRIPDDSHTKEQLMINRPEDVSEESWLHRIAAEAGHRLHLLKSLRGRDGLAFLEDYKIIKTPSGYTVYMRSELLTPLEEHLKTTPPAEADALRFCLQISDAVACLEKAGITHRNIKPSNLFVNEKGDFKLGDLAFPKIQIPQSEFTSPEAPAKAVGEISDELFSLCAVVKKCFAPKGKLLLLCEKACHADPAKRFHSVEQFQDALMKISGETALITYEEPKPALTKERKKRGRRALIGMFILGAVLVICLTLYLRLSVLFFTNVDPAPPGKVSDTLIPLSQTPEGTVLMSDFSGLSADTVKASLERLGFFVKYAYDLSDKAAGTVLGQSAPAGTALSSPREIWLLVSCKEEAEVTPRIRSIRLPSDAMNLRRSKSISPTLTLSPEDSDPKELIYHSSDPRIFTVDNGVLTGLSQGTATLTVTDVTGLARATATVTVTADTVQMPLLVGLNEEEAKKQLTALGLSYTVIYEYSDGETYTVLAQDPESKTTVSADADVTLTVSLGNPGGAHVPVREITLSHSSLQLNGGDSFSLTASILPAHATNTALSWLSSDKSVATVNADGVVTGVSDGTATIRVISADGGKSALCTVTVVTASYTVVYDANGGSGSMEPGSFVYRVPKQLSDCSFTRNGFSFSGWALTPDAEEPAFINRQTVSDLSNQNGAVVRLYAVWTPMEFTISYDPNGGSVTTDFFHVTYGDTFGELATPRRVGYEFVGWFSNRQNGIQIHEDTVVTADSPTTLYARWRRPSDPVPESEVPEGVEIVPNKSFWSYQILGERTVNEPVDEPSWTLLREEQDWKVTEEATLRYAAFPQGFSTASPLYQKYNQAPPAEGINGKVRVQYGTTETVGYLYWHWTRPSQGALPSDAPISQKQSTLFHSFAAFESTELLPTADANGKENNGYFFADRKNPEDGSWWWLRLPIQETSYTVSTLETVYTYRVQETLSSPGKPTRPDAQNLTKMVYYYIYE